MKQVQSLSKSDPNSDEIFNINVSNSQDTISYTLKKESSDLNYYDFKSLGFELKSDSSFAIKLHNFTRLLLLEIV